MTKQKIGTGNTAEVFDWDDKKVLKLFYEGYPQSAVYQEYENASLVGEFSFPKPIAYEIVEWEDRLGIVYDKVLGESLEEWVLNNGDIDGCALYMSRLHQKIHQFEQKQLPDYREFLNYHIQNANTMLQVDKEEALQVLRGLPEGNTICHGDYHPGNILISGEDTSVIDFMNLCRGNYLYDIARTVYLVGYTPVSETIPNKDFIITAKRALTDKYLLYMGVTKDMIEDYLIVIKAARAGECPNE